MPIYTFPADLLDRRGPSSINWSLASNTLQHVSPLTGATRTISLPGARWKFTATWNALSPYQSERSVAVGSACFSDRSIIEAFLAKLNGRAGRFYFYPPEQVSNTYLWGLGPYSGSAVTEGTVDGGGQTGTSLNITATYYRVAVQGQFFEVNGELKRVTDATGNTPDGRMTLLFSPPLRASPPNGANVKFVKPLGIFMLQDDVAGLNVGPGGYADFTLDAVEAFL